MNEHTYHPRQDLMPAPPSNIHLIGIGGIGVSGLARMLRDSGYTISGSDIADSPIVQALLAEGTVISIGHRLENVHGADLVVTTAAAPADNPELAEASRLGIPVVKRAALLGLLSRNKKLLAIAGTHGKSTTSGMAAVAFTQAGLNPTFAVGATVPDLGSNARLGSGEYFVAEADEYDHSFLWLQPDVAIVTNIEHDHPDIFPDLGAVMSAFVEFSSRIKSGGALVACTDDPAVRHMIGAGKLPAELKITTYGTGDAHWQWHAKNVITGPADTQLTLRLRVPGRHNQMNALAVLAGGAALGIDPATLVPGLEHFSGIGRRMEVVFEDDQVTIVDDYAHHPTEIKATIQATRESYPGRRALLIFQPHTYSRTRALLAEFAEALDQADEVIIAPIYPARETDNLGVSSESISTLMKTPVVVATSVADSALLANASAAPGDVILAVGAGDIYLASQLIANERRSG